MYPIVTPRILLVICYHSVTKVYKFSRSTCSITYLSLLPSISPWWWTQRKLPKRCRFIQYWHRWRNMKTWLHSVKNFDSYTRLNNFTVYHCLEPAIFMFLPTELTMPETSQIAKCSKFLYSGIWNCIVFCVVIDVLEKPASSNVRNHPQDYTVSQSRQKQPHR
jgi:hypothetical protein